MRSSVLMAFVLGSLFWLSGCGGLPPVTGVITIDGKAILDPLTGTVKLHPEGSSTVPEGPLTGGIYTIATAGNPGAPVGKYKVTVTVMAKKGARLFDAKYEDVNKTPLSVEVVANPAPGAYDIKLTSK